MEFRQKLRRKPTINITPLIDVLLLLLIFFVVSSRFVESPNVKLELPASRNLRASAISGPELLITREGTFYLDGRAVPRDRLQQRLKEVRMSAPSPKLVLRADRDTSYGIVVIAMDAARGAGFRKIVAPTVSGRDVKGGT